MSSVLRQAMHMLDCEEKVEGAITAWVEVHKASRLDAARQCLITALEDESPDPDLISAARSAFKKEHRAARKPPSLDKQATEVAEVAMKRTARELGR